MPNVILLGDSIFDNASYVPPGEPDVVRQLRAILPAGWDATLLAVDGNYAADVPTQLRKLPRDATHLVLSAGGNDALGNTGIFDHPARTGMDIFRLMAKVQREFRDTYGAVLDRLVGLRLPLVVCTIHEGDLDPTISQPAAAALAVFNDAIIRAAAERGIPVIDLRAVCNQPDCYANPIEPSAVGGARIAATIAAVLASHDFNRRHTVVYAGPNLA